MVAPDGKILVATTSCPRCEVGPKSEARVTRLLPSGRPDRSFGGDGSVDVPFGRRYNYAQAVALAANGDILLGGIRVNYQVGRGESSFTLAVARLRANGSLDRSFGGDGVSVLPGGAEIGVFDIAPTPSGGVVVETGDTIETFLWELRHDGSTDRSFGGSGIVEAPSERDVDRVLDEELFYVPKIAVLLSGRLLLAGTSFGFRGNRVSAIRLLPDGRPDRSYGNKIHRPTREFSPAQRREHFLEARAASLVRQAAGEPNVWCEHSGGRLKFECVEPVGATTTEIELVRRGHRFVIKGCEDPGAHRTEKGFTAETCAFPGHTH